MAVKIRLQRHGKKGKPFFHIVAADSRSPRDGKYIERIGSYNPNTNPATIELDNEKALEWMKNGAQPTDTARAILSYRGVMYRQHLQKGVAKGAFSQEEADRRFEAWKEGKDAKIQAKRDRLAGAMEEASRKNLKLEREVNEARIKALAAAPAPEVEEAPAEAPSEAPAAEAGEAPAEA
ncbi:MAG: 30S ribosomal protein S16 [Flavobacteriales bacterium]|nr:30S ribosomal protein S16 [Flavobacteriales bacterium]